MTREEAILILLNPAESLSFLKKFAPSFEGNSNYPPNVVSEIMEGLNLVLPKIQAKRRDFYEGLEDEALLQAAACKLTPYYKTLREVEEQASRVFGEQLPEIIGEVVKVALARHQLSLLKLNERDAADFDRKLQALEDGTFRRVGDWAREDKKAEEAMVALLVKDWALEGDT